MVSMGSSYHMKTLISKFSRLITGGGIYAGSFLIHFCDFLNLRDSLLQLRMHCTIENRMSNIIT